MNFTDKYWQKITKKHTEANFLQSPSYGKMNELLGEKVIVEDFGGKGHALMIVRDAKRGKYLEIPCGPLMDWKDKKLTKEVFQRIGEIAKEEKYSKRWCFLAATINLESKSIGEPAPYRW